MQTVLTLDAKISLDKPTATVILAIQEMVRNGNVNEAFRELRKIPLQAASHPAVVHLRRRLVGMLIGSAEETNTELAETAV